MEPPETDEKRAIWGNRDISFSRQRAPRWNNVARNPPPERGYPHFVLVFQFAAPGVHFEFQSIVTSRVP